MFATSIKHAQINTPVQRVLKQKGGGGGPQQRKTDVIVLIVSSISDRYSTVRMSMADVM